MSNPYERIRDHGHIMNRRTAAMLAEVEKRCGFKLTVVQGSYRAGNGASAGTHDGGGVIDLRTWNLTVAQRNESVLIARRVGFAAWYRTRAQGFDPHMHWVALGDRDLSPSARRQEIAYRNGRNGLASNRPDDGPRVRPIVVFDCARWEAEQSGGNITISMRAIQMAARGEGVSHSYAADVQMFMPFAVAVRAIPNYTRQAWLNSGDSRTYVSYAVRRLQADNRLSQDGIFGPVTAALMKPYGYQILN